MPGLIMTHVPSELSRRTAQNFSETPNTQTATGTSINCSSARQHFSTPQMTISTAPHPTSSASAQYHGGAASTMMSASSSSRIARPAERLRLREWLKKMIETQAIQGLYWIDKERQIVKIPWKHAARHGWSRDKDACLFRAWAIHTKKYDPTTDSPKANPKVWKANFRCAINSLPDIEELREKGKTKGNDAYKVYRLHPKKTRRQREESEGGCKVVKRQRSSSKNRANKTDKKHRKRNGLIIPSSENLKMDPSSMTKLPNTSNELKEDLLKKRMAEIRAAKSDHMSLNFKCVFKPNGLSSTSVSSNNLLSPMSPPSTLQSPMTPYSMTTSNGVHFASPNAYSSGMTHGTSVSPCSTVASTPASTPQSPPPPYQVVMNSRQETQYRINMDATFELSHQNQMGYEGYHDDLSDSDSCGTMMSDKEVADLVIQLKEHSPGHSSGSSSPLDGNNNLDTSMDYSSCWTNHRHPDERIFFSDAMAMANNRVMAGDLPGYEQAPLMTQIKVEPETQHPMQAHHHNSMINGYASLAGLNTQHQDLYVDSNYLLHQL